MMTQHHACSFAPDNRIEPEDFVYFLGDHTREYMKTASSCPQSCTRTDTLEMTTLKGSVCTGALPSHEPIKLKSKIADIHGNQQKSGWFLYEAA